MIDKTNNRLLSWLSDLALIISNDFIDKKSEVYFALPDNKKTKLMISSKISYRGYINAMALYPSFTLTQKLKRTLAIGMNIFKVIVPRRFFIQVGNTFLANELYKNISTQYQQSDRVHICSTRIGSRGRGRKIICQFQDKDNQIVSYIKVADPQYRGPYLEAEKNIRGILSLDLYYQRCLVQGYTNPRDNR